MRMDRRSIVPMLLCAALVPASGWAPAPVDRRADQEALAPFAGLVGDWKGTGQPRRGSAEGSWRESGSWAWSLSGDSAALELTVTDGKLLRSARLRPDPSAPGRFLLDATLPVGPDRRFSGPIDDRGRLRLDLEGPGVGDGIRRVSITPLHEDRVLILFEGRSAGQAVDARLAEVGYTRQGVAFATGSSGPECIVTGGKGTIAVSFEGSTYYVCCSGCKDLFDEDPAAIVEEYRRGRQAGGKRP
jgi:YHS domain-containing protein